MKKIVSILLAMACMNAPAFELALTDTEKQQCGAQGGCLVLSRDLLRAALREAHDAGRATCRVRL